LPVLVALPFELFGSIPQLLSRHDSLFDETVPIVVMFLGSCALRPVCRRLWRQSQSWIAFELKATAWAVVVGILCAGATGVALFGFHDVVWLDQAPILVWSASVLFIWCSLYFSIKQWQQSTEEKQRLLRAETEAERRRLLALRYQLNPISYSTRSKPSQPSFWMGRLSRPPRCWRR